MKTFSNRSNAIRAARKALGPEAVPNLDFSIIKHGNGKYGWIDARTMPAAEPAAPAEAPAEEPVEEPAAEAPAAPPAAGNGAGKPKRETKADAVVAMLRRDGGASGPQLQAATGWAPHSVRGFLSRLQKTGVTVQSERIRRNGDVPAHTRYWIPILAALAIVCGLPGDRAAAAPAFDRYAYCAKVARFAGGSYQIETACLEQEFAAMQAMRPAGDRIGNYCAQVSRFAGGSYALYNACVEQELAAKARLGAD